MIVTKNCLNRRLFIHNVVGAIVAVTTAPNNLFAKNVKQNLIVGSIGIDSAKMALLTNAISHNNLSLSFYAENQKSDIFFTNDFSIQSIKNNIQNHSIIIIEGLYTTYQFDQLISFCDAKGIYLAEVVKWVKENDEGKVFDRIIFYETKFNHQSVSQSINYLNLLSKLSAPTGLIIA